MDICAPLVTGQIFISGVNERGHSLFNKNKPGCAWHWFSSIRKRLVVFQLKEEKGHILCNTKEL